MKRPATEQLSQRAAKVSPGGVHSPVRAATHTNEAPVFTESAQGARITDADGNIYTDYCMAFGPLILGHKHPAVMAAAQSALEDGWSFGTAERYSLQLAELIRTHIPAAEQMRFVNSGTEAVMTALRLARGATGRNKLLKFSGCYHGHTDAMLIDAGSGLSGSAMSAGIPSAISDDTLVVALDDESQLEKAFAEYGHNIAAAIIEPLPANYGLLPQRQALLEKLASLCRSNGTLLIFDEVISGFRTGFGGYTEICGIEPDLRIWGKIIGAGFPVGAVAGRQELLERLAPVGDVYQAGTLSANPLAMRAGLAALEQLTDGTIYQQLEKLGAHLETGVAEIPGFDITRSGSVFWLHDESGITPARDTTAWQTHHYSGFSELFSHLLAQGIYIAPSPYEVCFLSAAHSEADIDRFVTALAAFKPAAS